MFSVGIERDQWHKMGLSKRETPEIYLEELLVTTHFQLYPFKRQSHKMAKHTQTIRRQIANELFDCVRTFCEVGA